MEFIVILGGYDKGFYGILIKMLKIMLKIMLTLRSSEQSNSNSQC